MAQQEKASELGKILIILNTLEVKEVDLEKELDVYFDTHDYEFVFDDYIELAKYFFELGLKTQKGK